MTGILIVTHANLGATLIETLEFILGEKQKKLESISMDIKQDPENLRKKLNRESKMFIAKMGLLF